MKAALWFLFVPVLVFLLLGALLPWSAEILGAAAAELVAGGVVLWAGFAIRRRLLGSTSADVPSPEPAREDGVRTTLVLIGFGAAVIALAMAGSRLKVSPLSVEVSYIVAVFGLGAVLGVWSRTPAVAVSATLVSVPVVLGVAQLATMAARPHSAEGVLFAGGQIAVRVTLLLVHGAIGLSAWLVGSALASTGGTAAVTRRIGRPTAPVLLALAVVVPPCVDFVLQPSPTADAYLVPTPGRAIVTLTKRSQIPAPGDTSIVARSGSDLVAVFPGVRQTETWVGVVATVRGDRLVPLESHWTIPPSGVDLRASLDTDDPIVVVSTGSEPRGQVQARAISLRSLASGASESDATGVSLGSPIVVRARDELLAVGFLPSEAGVFGAMFRELRGQGPSDLVTYPLDVSTTPKAESVAGFPDYGRLAAAVMPDGGVHVLTADTGETDRALPSVRYFRFDASARRWQPGQTLWRRDVHVSEIEPRLTRTGSALDAFWLAGSWGDRPPGDGLYTNRIGETTTWRLTSSRGAYAILANADDKGTLLVGVALAPSEDGRIRWFVRRNDRWSSAGETDLGFTAYTLSSGTEPFALWRDSITRSPRAAFVTAGGLVVYDINVNDEP